MTTTRRLLKLWKMYAALDLAFITADPKLVAIFLLSDMITNLAAISGMLLLAERFAGIGPWSQAQVIFLLGYATIVRGFLDILFGYNVLMISRRIGRGQLDHTLMQPLPIWVVLLSEGFMPFSGFGSLLPGFVLFLWALPDLHLPLTLPWLALMFINVLASMTIVLAFSCIWGSLAFWAPRAAEEISSSAMNILEKLKPFPFDGLGPILMSSLLSIIPVGFVAWYPCRALLGLETSASAGWITPLMAILFCSLAFVIFRKGLEHYGRTGSQRYSSFGHRS